MENIKEIPGDADQIVLGTLIDQPLKPGQTIMKVGREENFHTWGPLVDLPESDGLMRTTKASSGVVIFIGCL